MGFFNKDLKNRSTDNKNLSVKKREYDKIPVYPSKVQSTAFPEKVYIFAIQKLILTSIILFVLSVILGISIYYKTFLFKPDPLFIYYSNHEKKFKLKKFYNPSEKSIYHNIQILAEDFLRNWITDYYSIDIDNNINNSKWCNCFENKEKEKSKQESYENMNCSICQSSDRNIYNIFFEFVKPVKEERYNSNIVRIVKILNVEPFFYGLINHNIAKQSILEEIALTSITAFKESLNQMNEKITPFRSYMFYIKVDFMTIDFKNGKHINTEFQTSYNTVALRLFQNESGHLGINKNWTKQFIVLEHSTNFILHNKYIKTDISDVYKKYNQMILSTPINIENENKYKKNETNDSKIKIEKKQEKTKPIAKIKKRKKLKKIKSTNTNKISDKLKNNKSKTNKL